jgi:hypothetical protein|tara:strand:+ start:1362 stop:1613 length:252 start_codon:yes stop_codon:yes gene_type:complete
MLLNNPQIRALDKFFETAMGRDLSPFAVMDRVLDSVTQNVPPKDGAEFTVYKMVPVNYRVEYQEDGSVHYNIISKDESTEEDK